jgi:cytochrome c oxidase subunit 4
VSIIKADVDMNQTTTKPDEAGLAHAGQPAGVHVVPLKVLLAVWSVLLVLTCLTVAATWVDLGGGNLWLAMVIATVKASLVALYFMHLRYDQPFYAIVLLTALLFILLFVGLVLVDTTHYQYQLITSTGLPS